MKNELKYIELKSGFSHNGPAWIGLVSFSKSGKTVYFDGKAFQRIGSDRTRGNYYNIENGDEYWISGVSKDTLDRHQFGNGKIFVEKRILKEYLQLIKKTELPKSSYELTEVNTKKPIERIHEMENSKMEKPLIDQQVYKKTPKELTNEELEYLIVELIEDEKHAKYNKGRRMIKKDRIELEMELGKRK